VKAGASTATIPSLCAEPLATFIPRVSPRFVYPHWLGPLLDELARAEAALRGEGPPVRVLVSVPPQHGKSTAVLHWLARLIGRYPWLRHAYCTYSASLSTRQSRACRRISVEAGVTLDPSAQRLEEWLTPQEGGISWTSIGGPLTGKPIDGIGIIDDPFKDRREAESQAIRETTWDWYTDTFLSRIHPGASQFVVATRWHVDDLSGRLAKQGGWTVVNLPAIDEEGAALWPEGRPIDWLLERKSIVGEYGWWSMYMGQPRPKGGALFDIATTCKLSDVPRTGRVSIGVDLAYTKKTSADYSTAVVLRECGGKVYVTHVLREQVMASDFVERLQRLGNQNPGAPMVWHGSTTERGGADAIRSLGLPQLRAKLATADKFVRSQEVAAAWNRGDVIVPHDAPWSRDFLDELQAFTGVGDRHDDQVDALASAFDGLPKGSGKPLIGAPPVFGTDYDQRSPGLKRGNPTPASKWGW